MRGRLRTSNMVDIDNFKKVNDEHGHAVGDQVLREVARRLRASVRRYDVVGRYGGEEFLAVLPETSLDGASAVAERMRSTVANEPVATDAGEITVTVSLGISLAPHGSIDLERAILHADEALYEAKAARRNQVRGPRPALAPALS